MNYKVPVIPGDGIGPEIIAEGKEGFGGSSRQARLLPGVDGVSSGGGALSEDRGAGERRDPQRAGAAIRAIYLGAIGDPRVKPGDPGEGRYSWPCASTLISM